MKNYISEGRAIYEDINHGTFSRKLAEWAISLMQTENSGRMVDIQPSSLDELERVATKYGITIDPRHLYTAWYLYNMTKADYAKSLPSEEARIQFVDETLNDPDGCPESVLECFTAKMCMAGIPIFWEKYL